MDTRAAPGRSPIPNSTSRSGAKTISIPSRSTAPRWLLNCLLVLYNARSRSFKNFVKLKHLYTTHTQSQTIERKKPQLFNFKIPNSKFQISQNLQNFPKSQNLQKYHSCWRLEPGATAGCNLLLLSSKLKTRCCSAGPKKAIGVGASSQANVTTGKRKATPQRLFLECIRAYPKFMSFRELKGIMQMEIFWREEMDTNGEY
ncbi:uncharacterized protein [Gossypium hirsutum]|uniref:Uncharacterized protein n=1 Tax=Gossypium hirsutum TaxID=3635 RepID=A0ABM2ZC01_GOSHI|nr:uncharacterized protein LOC107916889 [Gossypium hirsutum]